MQVLKIRHTVLYDIFLITHLQVQQLYYKTQADNDTAKNYQNYFMRIQSKLSAGTSHVVHLTVAVCHYLAVTDFNNEHNNTAL
jgi:hypothetical protein